MRLIDRLYQRAKERESKRTPLRFSIVEFTDGQIAMNAGGKRMLFPSVDSAEACGRTHGAKSFVRIQFSDDPEDYKCG